jgi:vacuolar-type H+-ATPase subunit H
MSQNYGEVPPSSTTGAGSPSGTTETAKQEATEVTSTARAEAGHVVETAKDEAATVAREAKTQAKQVYTETRRQLTDQAATQQQRVADGLRAIGEELQSMAQGSENPGMASDLVREASTRLTGASSWLSQRDPGSLLNEVKSFARRKPGMFIAGALLAGVAAGRLTRALAENTADEKAASASTGTGSTVPTPTPGGAGAVGGFGAGTPAPVGTTTASAGAAGVGGYSTGAVNEPTPMYDESRAANPAAQPYVGGEPDDDR